MSRMVWYAFLAMLFVGFVTTGFADGFFSKNATLVMSDTARNPANGDMTVSVRPLDEERESAFPALLRVEIGTRLARLTVRFPQQVCINQVGQGRAHPVRIVGGRRRKALAFWWAGW